MNINGNTEIIAHIGYPTYSFKAPMIYNPYFASHGINAVVVPMAVTADDFESVVRAVFKMKNVRGALITMPHKQSALSVADEVLSAAAIAGAANALMRDANGSLVADMFDGEGFVRGLQTKGFSVTGKRAFVLGAGGVGSAIAASLARAGVSEIGLCDTRSGAATSLAMRVRPHFPQTQCKPVNNDPTGYDLIVNATPLGMQENDPLPIDPAKLHPAMFVGEVVMAQELTPLLRAAKALGCPHQLGTDMLFEMIPAYLDFFGFTGATAAQLRSTAQLEYLS